MYNGFKPTSEITIQLKFSKYNGFKSKCEITTSITTSVKMQNV